MGLVWRLPADLTALAFGGNSQAGPKSKPVASTRAAGTELHADLVDDLCQQDQQGHTACNQEFRGHRRAEAHHHPR